MRFRSVLAPLLLALVACSSPTPEPERVTLTLNDGGSNTAEVTAEIADEPDEWSRGYIDRPAPEPGTGILFIFDGAARHSFHMRGVAFDLDLISILDGEVVGVTRMTACPSGDCRENYPTPPLDLALEVAAGSIPWLEPGARVVGL